MFAKIVKKKQQKSNSTLIDLPKGLIPKLKFAIKAFSDCFDRIQDRFI